MLKVGDTIKHNGADCKITEIRNSHYVVYVTDRSGGYHTNIKLPDLESYEEQSETAAKPKRYNKSGATLEVWDAIDQLGLDYKQGNILKYIYRFEDKNGVEDLLKAINYIIKIISIKTGEDYYDLHKLSQEELAKRLKRK
jgi:hypothetical protein